MSQRTDKRHPSNPPRRAKTRAVELHALGKIPAELNDRQKKLRRIIIATRGNFSMAEVAKDLGCGRMTVWQDLRVIRAFEPPEAITGWSREDEARAIDRAVQFYEGAIAFLVDELALLNEYQRRKSEEYAEIHKDDNDRSKILRIEDIMNVKLGLFNTMALYRRDLNNFMTQIGLIQEAPKRIQVEDGTAGAKTLEAIREGLDDVRTKLKLLRSRREQIEKRATAAKKVAKKKAAKKRAPRKKPTTRKGGDGA